MLRKLVSSIGKRIKRPLLGVAPAIAVLGQTTSTVDTTTFTQLLTSLMPLLVTMIGIAIPIIFFNKIMDLIEKLFKSFS
ncbi:MAG: hypothetical protein F7C36_00365 [Desulfurococcales archaeon]|nr:hypothetical protein [Desulfurococcales archaeon]